MTLTLRGGAFLVVGFISLAAAPLLRSLALAAFGLTLLACLAWALRSTRAPSVTATRVLSADLAREGARVEVEVRIQIERGGADVEVEDRFPAGLVLVGGERTLGAAPGGEARLSYAIEGRIPGRFAPGPLRVRHRDPLGLVEHVVEAPAGPALKVLPRAEALPVLPVSSRASMAMSGLHLVGQAGPGSDFYALRDFQSGDAIRDVNWRASARGGRLVVNQREKETQARVTFLLDGRIHAKTGTRGLNAHVLQLRALASLADAALRRKDRPRVVVYGDGAPVTFEGSGLDPGAATLLGGLVEREPQGQAGAAAAVDALLPTLRPKAPIVLLTSALGDDTVPDAVRALRALEQHVLVVAPRGPDLLRNAGASDVEIAEARQRHADVLAQLRAQGAVVLDWAPDEPLALAVLREVGA